MSRRRRTALIRWITAIAFSYVALVLADGVLRLTPLNVHEGRYERNRAAGERHGVPFDSRTGWQVIADLRATGRPAYPFITPAHIRRGDLEAPTLAGERVVPIGGISNVTTVVCNETGTWMVYEADEHGFNNPPGLWSARPKWMVVGDSFAHGTCLNRGREFVSLLRESVGSVLGVATHGSGPVTMLAQIREYAARVRPPVVLWVYYEGNDVTVDVSSEWADPTLRRYLDPTFSQRLVERQRVLDRLLTDQIAPPPNESSAARTDATWGQAIAAAVTLREVRVLARKSLARTVRLGPLRRRWFDEQYAEPLSRFEDALGLARDEVGAWDGRLVFVYLPSWEAFHASWNDGVVLKPSVLDTVRELGIPVIDLEPAFRNLPAPDDAFVFGLPNHLSELGNRIVADRILAEMRALDIGSPEAPDSAGRSVP